jgi:hypothetical protein
MKSFFLIIVEAYLGGWAKRKILTYPRFTVMLNIPLRGDRFLEELAITLIRMIKAIIHHRLS